MVLWRDVVCILEIYNIIILLNRYYIETFFYVR